MTTSLREGLTFCRLADRIVFLDIPADRYFCLSREAENVFSRASAGEPIAEFERAILAKTGIVRRAASPFVFRECSKKPALRSALEQDASSGGRLALARMCARFLYAQSSLQRRGLAQTLASMVRIKPTEDQADLLAVAVIADAYRRCIGLIGSHDRCLAYAIAVARSLYAAGAAADVVIGIGMPPFRAHAWVQWRDVLVNERLEIAAHYTPIAVL
ncbi:lasso peptide biosynthesis B2 protein [Novosphingobium sp. RL4]|uniref:lasso peptide biosynthesis B2 protein n=1 Tax=Novosphingobium sp. RL4 TaxID=3109595 RepID=UPI002D765C8A|nr:lasso peptide biosynthesis B2 protein [Novosphingobium sp. RL4]WRT94458.1 lasso peptide biosynthesis B2 protein [Novosphingobium sp. RL4]